MMLSSASALAEAPKLNCHYDKNSQEDYFFFNDFTESAGGYKKTKTVDGIKFDISINDAVPSMNVPREITVRITDTTTGVNAIAFKNLILNVKDRHHVKCDFAE